MDFHADNRAVIDLVPTYIPWDAKAALIAQLQARDAQIISVRDAVIVFGSLPSVERRLLNLVCDQKILGKHPLTWVEPEQLLQCLSHEYPNDPGQLLG